MGAFGGGGGGVGSRFFVVAEVEVVVVVPYWVRLIVWTLTLNALCSVAFYS